VSQSTASIDEAIRSLWLSGMIATVAIAACFVLVGWWVNRLGVRPIRDATEVARAITAGRRDERVGDTTGNTEAATLGTAINLMLDSTAETEGRLRSFVADASHELRTPLTSLMGYADLHRQGLLASGEAVDDAMRRIRGEAGRMSMIVEHLFVLASLDEAAVPIERQRVDVAQLLEDVAADAGAAHPDRVIEVDTAAAVELEADRDLLFQAVSVFVSNAVVHTPVSSIVSLAARVDGSSLVIGVTDSGPGIAQEHLGRLFDRFYRVDPGRARTQGGSGLGLAIARSIAEAHGGSVAAASTVGVGSTFQLRLPLSAA
jgi:two-component system OmpR family sensor kinase